MDLSFRKFTWILCLAFLFGLIEAEDPFQSNSHLFNKELLSGNIVSDDKPQFPSLDNLKSAKIESGYSGILIPDLKTIDKAETYLENIGVDKGILEYFKLMVPKTIKALFKFVVKIGAVAVTAILVLLISSSAAAAFCSYSELCSLKFTGLGWQKDDLEESFRAFVTPEKLSLLGSFIHNAIRKYENLNKKKFRSLK